jgi:transposase
MNQPTAAMPVGALLALIDALQARNRMLEQQNAVLTARVAELERRLGLDSSNSSKPPSSDGPGKPPRRTQSLRKAGQNKPGGQPGHAGKHLNGRTGSTIRSCTVRSCAQDVRPNCATGPRGLPAAVRCLICRTPHR